MCAILYAFSISGCVCFVHLCVCAPLSKVRRAKTGISADVGGILGIGIGDGWLLNVGWVGGLECFISTSLVG